MTNSPWFWSSTTNATSTEKAWGVCFLDGHISPHDKIEARRYVRCVRNGVAPRPRNAPPPSADAGVVTKR